MAVPVSRQNSIGWIWIVLLTAAVIVAGYYTDRVEHLQLQSLLVAGMAACWLIYRSEIDLRYALAAGIFIRLLLIWMEPNLSEDIYRYIWDGQLLSQGLDPFLHLPSWYAASGEWPAGTGPALYDLLNSKEYYAVYPPVAMYMFRFVAAVSDGSIAQQILLFRLFVLLAEFGSIVLLYRLSKQFGTHSRSIILYVLNPVVIIELTGNLHLEAFMLFFILLSLSFFPRRLAGAAISQGAAVATKLVPLVLMPIWVFRMPWKKAVMYVLVSFVTLGILFYPLLTPGLLSGMSDSIELYFQTFEFNASYYFVLRAIGFWKKGYNVIGEIGPVLGFLSFLCITLYGWSVRRDEISRLPVHLGMALVLYLVFSTTVHPWYVLPVLGLFSLTNYKFAFVWSYLVMWSYLGYTGDGYTPPLGFIALEYGVVLVLLSYEIFEKGTLFIRAGRQIPGHAADH